MSTDLYIQLGIVQELDPHCKLLPTRLEVGEHYQSPTHHASQLLGPSTGVTGTNSFMYLEHSDQSWKAINHRPWGKRLYCVMPLHLSMLYLSTRLVFPCVKAGSPMKRPFFGPILSGENMSQLITAKWRMNSFQPWFRSLVFLLITHASMHHSKRKLKVPLCKFSMNYT